MGDRIKKFKHRSHKRHNTMNSTYLPARLQITSSLIVGPEHEACSVPYSWAKDAQVVRGG